MYFFTLFLVALLVPVLATGALVLLFAVVGSCSGLQFPAPRRALPKLGRTVSSA